MSRARPHSEARFARLVRIALARGCDHLLVTGDVTDAPDPGDLRRVIRLLQGLGLWHPAKLTLLPGNHDLDTPEGRRSPMDRRGNLARFLEATRAVNRPVGAPGAPLGPGTPVLKRLGELCLVGVCSASPHHPIEGRVLEEDAAFVRQAFRGGTGTVRVVAVHHHPDPLPVGRHPDLGRFIPEGTRGGRSLLRACAEAEVSLVLHGHIHTAGGPFDRRWGGVDLRCQGTAKGEKLPAGARRYGFDRYLVDRGRAERQPWHEVVLPELGEASPPAG